MADLTEMSTAPLESFAELTDRILPAPVALSAWCPTMDLLAVAFTDGRIAVHRLNWQRLWLVTPDAAPTALAWTPSGDALAVGRTDGAVTLLASDTGDVLREDRCEGCGSVTALTWVEEPDPAPDGAAVPQLALQGRAQRFCLPPPTAIPAKPTSQGGSAEVATGWQPAAAKLTLLGVAYGSGSISICTAALLELTHLTPSRLAELGLAGGSDAADTADAAAAAATQVAISRDLRHLLLLRQASGESQLEVLSAAALGQTAAQLRYQAPLTSQVLACLQSAREAAAAAGREWGDATAAVGERLAALQGLLRDNMDAGSPAGELRRLLASGAVSDPLRQWLTASLGEAGLRRLARQVDGSLAASARLLGDVVAAAVRVAAFQLGDVAGLAHPPCHLPASGLQAAELERARGLAAQLLVRCEQTRLAVTAAAADYRRLCAWLLQWIRRLDVDADSMELGPSLDVLKLADFLDNQFQQDRIGSELQAPQPGQAAEGALPAIGGSACELLQLVGLLPVAADTSLWSLVRDLEHAARAGLCGTSAALSPTLRPLLSLQLRSTPLPAEQGLQPTPAVKLQLQQVPAEDGDPRVAWVAWAGMARPPGGEAPLPHLGILRVMLPPPGAGAQEPVVEAGAVRLPAGSSVVDTGFYQDGRLAVLLLRQSSGAGTSAAASLMLVPLHEVPQPLSAEQRDDDILKGCVDRGAVSVPLPRQRAVPHGNVAPPLAISGPRGVACVATALPRVLLYDLEAEDEEDEDGEEDDEREGGEDDAMPEDS